MNLFSRFKVLWGPLAELLYPRVCLVCGESLLRGEQYLCTACLADLPFVYPQQHIGEHILSQWEDAYRPQQLYSLFYYNKYSPYKQLIYAIKYRSFRDLGNYLGTMLGERMGGVCKADCIVPVPLHPKRERKRGFNQALEIAKGINEVLKIDICGDVLCRVRNNASQTGKNAGERLKNVEHIFELRHPEKLAGRHILLVDDVITTGATIGECLRVLCDIEQASFSLACLALTL